MSELMTFLSNKKVVTNDMESATTLAQRTREGLAAARRRGKKLGRPAKLSPKQLSRIRERFEANGETLTRIAKDYGVAPWTITRTLRRHDAAASPVR